MGHLKWGLFLASLVLFASTGVAAKDHMKKAKGEVERHADGAMDVEESDKFKRAKQDTKNKNKEKNKKLKKDKAQEADKARYRDRAEDAGSDKAQEMRARQEERKAIKEEYKADVEAGGERVKGNKPWWKFWGED